MAALDDFLESEQVNALREQWITTVDDLYSSLYEDSPAIERLLNISESDAGRLREAIRPRTSSAMRDAIESADRSASRPLDEPGD